MIYLDYNATTPLKKEVFEAMAPFLTEEWGNASATYSFGSKLKAEIEGARRTVAKLIGANTNEIIFTGSATESCNTAIHSAIQTQPSKNHIVTSPVEHSAVLNYLNFLEKKSIGVTRLKVNKDGLLTISELEGSIKSGTALVSIMAANNETGVTFPISTIADICQQKNVIFHCDGTQIVGKIPINVAKIPINFFSFSAHKIGGPKGIGVLYVRKGTNFSPFIFGGHQERGQRGGTENIAAIMGFAKAAELTTKNIEIFAKKVAPLRDFLENEILSKIPNTELNGEKNCRIPNTTNITFHGINAEALLLLLDKKGICASSGSACLAESYEPSHVLRAMKGATVKRENIRFSLGLETKKEEISFTINELQNAVKSLSKINSY